MRRYGLLGEKLGHSFSPQIHAMLGSYDYQLYELRPDELPGFMRDNPLSGFNVTIPYKQAVMPYLQGLSPAAQSIGAVNTVIRQPDGNLYGDNTDAYGFECQLGEAEALRGRKALILGSGGASKTVQWVLASKGIQGIVISRQGEDNYNNLSRHQDAALIVNTTPVGMSPKVEASPLDLQGFEHLKLVLDLIYNPARTRLMLQAQDLGLVCRGGLSMLAAQAIRASWLFGQIPPGSADLDSVIQALDRRTRNIALIGMPGCGKSSVARALARLSGRPVFDTDQMLSESTGLSPAEIIQTHGEPAFRRMESQMLSEAGQQTGAIIATGGGVVTQQGNLNALRQNSRILWLKRPLHLLPTGNRPISQAEGLEALYQKRAPLYGSWSERSYDHQNIEKTARQIMEDWL